MLKNKFHVPHCVHVLDDFLFIGLPNSSVCYSSFLAFYSLAKDLNLPIKSEITVYITASLTELDTVTTSLTELDTIKFEVRLPFDKLVELKNSVFPK